MAAETGTRSTTRPRRRRGRRVRDAVRGRTNALLVATIAIALFASIQMLVLIGPPPWPRINELWIHAHRGQVRLLLFNLAVALAASGALALPRIGHRRARLAAFAIWCGAIGVVMQWCWPTAVIVARVMIARSL